MAEILVTNYEFHVAVQLGIVSSFDPGSAALDTWPASDGPPPGSAWTTTVTVSASDSGGLIVVSAGIAQPTISTGLNTAWYSAASFQSNVDVSIEIEQLPDSGGSVMLFCRLQESLSSFNKGIMAKWRKASAASSDSMEIWSISGGSATLEASFNVSMTTDYSFAMNASGDTITVLKGNDWVSVGSTSVGNVSGNGFIGIGVETKGNGNGKVKNPKGKGRGPFGGGALPGKGRAFLHTHSSFLGFSGSSLRGF